jgi:flagellar basal-body rod protein FlgG
MLRAMRTAATGMQAQQLFVDTVAHNLANVNTNGYKKTRILFEDLFYQTISPTSSTNPSPAAVMVGHGVRPVATDKIYSQGDTSLTGNPLDLVIEGDGFFQFLRQDGVVVYSRDGSLRLDGEGRLTNAGGLLVTPEITVPEDATALKVEEDGTVSALLAGQTDPQILGQIELVRFINPTGLHSEGGNALAETVASGKPIAGVPGLEGMGLVRQGLVELSNVKVVEEMVSLILAQRAYEINGKAIQTAEEMMGIVNHLKR